MTSGPTAMARSDHALSNQRPDAAAVNRLTTPCATTAVGDDAGRSILEAVVALALVAIAVISWGRLSVTSARTEATVAHREIALELATNSLEELRLRPWDTAAIDPESKGALRDFEGRPTVQGKGGVPARVDQVRDGREFTVTTHITDPGSAAWRNAIVIVEWAEGERTARLRLDSALRRPDAAVSR
ncbi:MAG: hypothetical protein R2707_14600 [Acidimicrobiales bacterium]